MHTPVVMSGMHMSGVEMLICTLPVVHTVHSHMKCGSGKMGNLSQVR